MGLFTTRQLLGYTEQKVKFRALFLELFFRLCVSTAGRSGCLL